MYDYLIVGAGLSGAIFAYEANKRGKKVKVIDKREHIGGNIYCQSIEGINVHKYGAHIFHTSNKRSGIMSISLRSLTITSILLLPTIKDIFTICL